MRGVFSLANRRRFGNHIGGLHAATMALLAETATGIVAGMTVAPTRRLQLGLYRAGGRTIRIYATERKQAVWVVPTEG